MASEYLDVASWPEPLAKAYLEYSARDGDLDGWVEKLSREIYLAECYLALLSHICAADYLSRWEPHPLLDGSLRRTYPMPTTGTFARFLLDYVHLAHAGEPFIPELAVLADAERPIARVVEIRNDLGHPLNLPTDYEACQEHHQKLQTCLARLLPVLNLFADYDLCYLHETVLQGEERKVRTYKGALPGVTFITSNELLPRSHVVLKRRGDGALLDLHPFCVLHQSERRDENQIGWQCGAKDDGLEYSLSSRKFTLTRVMFDFERRPKVLCRPSVRGIPVVNRLFELSLELRNRGNAPAVVNLHCRPDEGLEIADGPTEWQVKVEPFGQTVRATYHFIARNSGNYAVNFAPSRLHDELGHNWPDWAIAPLSLEVEEQRPACLRIHRQMVGRDGKPCDVDYVSVKEREPVTELVTIQNEGNVSIDRLWINCSPMPDLAIGTLPGEQYLGGRENLEFHINYRPLTEGRFSLPELSIAYQESDGMSHVKSIPSGVTLHAEPSFETEQLIDRTLEMRMLIRILDSVLTGRGQFALIIGEAGVGKSRLVGEFAARAEPRRVRVLLGRCIDQGRQLSYDVFRTALRDFFGIREGERGKVARQKIERCLEALPHWASEAQFFLNFLGLGGLDENGLERPEAHPDDTLSYFGHVIGLLFQLARKNPLLLLLEDLHWIDATSLDLLRRLVMRLEDEPVPILVCGTMRSSEAQQHVELQEALRSLSRQTEVYFEHNLDALSADDSYELIDHMFAGFSEREKDLIYQRADGIPFYVQQFLNLLYSEHRLTRMGNEWHLQSGVDLSRLLPQTIGKLLDRRFYALDRSAQQVIQCAAIVGHEFAKPVLSVALERPVGEDLDRLEREGLIKYRPGVPTDQGRYQFSHALIKDAVCRQIGHSRMIELNQKIGDAIETLYPDTLGLVSQLALHFQAAGNVSKTIKYGLLAAKTDHAHCSWPEASVWSKTVLELLAGLPSSDEVLEQRTSALIIWERAAESTGEMDTVAAILREAVAQLPEDPAHTQCLGLLLLALARVGYVKNYAEAA
ncbi:MAG: AAA family ATPase, partial [Chloroflexi bacterium]|nr:AAA family ATPase [Chloroflexota bacterium]